MTFSDLFSCLENHFRDCKIEKCKEKSIKLNVIDRKKFRNFVIFKGEKIVEKLHESIKICDCFIYCNFIGSDLLTIILIELKSSRLKNSQLEEKFTKSVEKIRYMNEVCDNINIAKIEFFPVLLYKHPNPIDIKAISTLKIRFEKNHLLICEKCDSNLCNIIDKYV